MHAPRNRRSPRRAANFAAAAAAANDSQQLQRVLDAIDDLNAADPRSIDYEGAPTPFEVAYSRWLSAWVERLASAVLPSPPSDELRIAARGQHVQRFKSPRTGYPEGREGYLKWRADLKRMHADTVAQVMHAHGYSEASCKRAKRLINKLDLKSDPEAQVLEDALCLVFMERQFAELAGKEGADKMVDIVRKTWGKMGEGGRAAALKLELAPAETDIVKRALGG